MNSRFFTIMAFVMFVSVIAGCGVIAKPLPSKKLQDFYPGDISKVDRIEIRNGYTWEAKTFTDKTIVQPWINEIRDLELKLDPNQGGRTIDYHYRVRLFEGDKVKLSFTAGKIGGTYLLGSSNLSTYMKALFQTKEPVPGN